MIRSALLSGSPFMPLLLFDFDGVIIDSFGILYQSALEAYPDLGTIEEYRRLFEGNIYTSAEDKKGNKDTITIEHPVFSRYIPRMLDRPPVHGMVPLLHEITETTSAVVVSSCLTESIKEYSHRYGLPNAFGAIYGADVEKSKERKMHLALTAYDRQPHEAVMITDTLGDLREAANVGVPTIAVTWGFHSQETLERGNPNHIVHSPDELRRAILRGI